MKAHTAQVQRYIIFTVTTMVAILLFSMSTFGAKLQLAGTFEATCDVQFKTEEVLSFPTKSSIRLSMMPAEEVDIYVLYGRENLPQEKKTEIRRARPNQTTIFSLDGLKPDSDYGYQVFCKKPHARIFGERDVHSFRTLREVTDTFSFAYLTDTHAYALWSQEASGAGAFNNDFEEFEATRDNLLSDDMVDFVILGGDWSMPNCSGCQPATIDGISVSGGSVDSQQETDLRYQKILEQEVLGSLFQETPFVYVLGDHEGESGWQTSTNLFGLQSRLKYLPNPFSAYRGDTNGRYYTFKTGPVQIIVIDVLANTFIKPQIADDWTLGGEQLAWLQKTLELSDSKWKFIFAEHLVGGETDALTSNFWKGRGSIKATDDDTPAGIYKGEQAQVDALMQQYGAQIFFSGNDHIASIGEKLNPDGSFATLHVIGGNAGVGASWSSSPDYMAEMTFPGYSIPSYLTNTIGTKSPGYFRITVNGKDNVLLEYVRTHLNNPTINGTTLFSYLLEN